MALIFDGYGQHQQRGYRKYKDQHGRRWGANVEHRTGDPVGNWEAPPAPITPPGYAIVKSTDPDNPNDIFIDYDRIIREGREALDEWEKEAMRLMRSRHRNNYKPGMEIDIDIADVLGPKPPAVEPWIAAKQGEPWILGLTTKVNLKVAAFMDLDKKKKDDEIDFLSGPEENFLALEEEVDPKATGGQRVPVPRKRTRKAKDTDPLDTAA